MKMPLARPGVFVVLASSKGFYREGAKDAKLREEKIWIEFLRVTSLLRSFAVNLHGEAQ
jgi:hypothetical protein